MKTECNTSEFINDFEKLCSSCPFRAEINDGIKVQIEAQLEEYKILLPQEEFQIFVRDEMRMAQQTMKEIMEMNLTSNTYAKNRTHVYIWNKERLKKLKRYYKIKKQEIVINKTRIKGDGNVVSNGSNNTITTSHSIVKGNIQSLEKELKGNGVSETDIAEIIEIVQLESPDKNLKQPGKKGKEWMKKMIGKSIDGSWNIGLGAAGELLATIISKYYGL